MDRPLSVQRGWQVIGVEHTVHVALGLGFKPVGGTNKSAIHWDIVKDLRLGGRIELDGKIVQENGVWAA